MICKSFLTYVQPVFNLTLIFVNIHSEFKNLQYVPQKLGQGHVYQCSNTFSFDNCQQLGNQQNFPFLLHIILQLLNSLGSPLWYFALLNACYPFSIFIFNGQQVWTAVRPVQYPHYLTTGLQMDSYGFLRHLLFQNVCTIQH